MARPLVAGSPGLVAGFLPAATLLFLAGCTVGSVATGDAGAPAVTEGPEEREETPEPVSDAPWVDAVRRGVLFRALGNEPYWVLEVQAETLTMITDLGQRRTRLNHQKPALHGETTTWWAEGEAEVLVAVAERRPCTDTMSGERFEVRVVVTFEERSWRGCGRFL